MTNPPPHGQAPEALIDLIDVYAETRHRCGGIYNAKTEAARKAVIEALSGVQALSAAPAIGDELRDTLVAVSAAIAERDDRAAQKMIGEILAASPPPTSSAEQQAPPAAAADTVVLEAALRAIHQAIDLIGEPDTERLRTVRRVLRGAVIVAEDAGEAATAPQQEATKAAPGELKDHQILAITTAYEHGVGKGHQAYKSGKEITNPYDSAYGCDLAWQYGYGEGKEQAQRATKVAPEQEAQEPVFATYTLPPLPEPDLRDIGTRPQDIKDFLTGYATEYAKQALRFSQPTPAPLSEMPYERRKAIQEGEQIGASDAWFHARINMLDTLDRRNVFRAGFDRGWNAALAAQGGKV